MSPLPTDADSAAASAKGKARAKAMEKVEPAVMRFDFARTPEAVARP